MLAAHVGRVLQQTVRTTDLVGRRAPDELAVVTHGQGASPETLQRRLTGAFGAGCPRAANEWSGRLRLGHALIEPWEGGEVTDVLVAAQRSMGRPLTVDGATRTLDAPHGLHEIMHPSPVRQDERRPS